MTFLRLAIESANLEPDHIKRQALWSFYAKTLGKARVRYEEKRRMTIQQNPKTDEVP